MTWICRVILYFILPLNERRYIYMGMEKAKANKELIIINKRKKP